MVEKIKNNYLLLLIIFFGAAFRFYHIDFQSVWLDEVHTINEANPSLSIVELYKSIMVTEQMPPLYFYLVYFLFKLFGYKTIVLRVFSAVLGTAGIYAIYLFAKELMNKKIGIYVAILLAVNYFHIYYSQEGRPYALFFLFTVLAFYRLVKFIKIPNRSNALYFGLFSLLMISSHFFALFALFAQYLIILFFILIEQKEKRKVFFINAVLSGLVVLILYIPALPILLKTTKISSFWIEMPTLDIYNKFFKAFFGTSEMLLIIINSLFVLYFIRLSKQDAKVAEIKGNKDILSFIIFAIWISIVLLIPLIRTYLHVPMIVDRYFINILPAILIIIAIGLDCIKNTIVKNILISFLVIFSITDIVIVKKYYKQPNKTQFREATQFINDNNSSKDNVVTSLGWYLPYFLNNDKVKNTIVGKSLDEYVTEMIQNPSSIKSFWYFDGHIRPYNPTEITKTFLQQNFVVDKNKDLFDCYVKHFILKSDYKPNIDISSYLPLKEVNGDVIKHGIDTFNEEEDKITISGWAILDNQDADNSKIYLVAINGETQVVINTEEWKRTDVTASFKNSFNLDNSGFKATVFKKDLQSGTHQLAIVVENSKTEKKGLIVTDKNIIIK